MQIKIFEIEKEDDGLRLDRWFHRNIPNMPFTIVAKLERKGQIFFVCPRISDLTEVENFLKEFRKDVPKLNIDRVLHDDMTKSLNFLKSFKLENELMFTW